jgi:hypothetical protein
VVVGETRVCASAYRSADILTIFDWEDALLEPAVCQVIVQHNTKLARARHII